MADKNKRTINDLGNLPKKDIDEIILSRFLSAVKNFIYSVYKRCYNLFYKYF